MKLSEIACKDIINNNNGDKLGKAIDLDIDHETGRIKELIVKKGINFFNLFKDKDSVNIPWKNIIKIGNDVIIVETEIIKQDKSLENKSK